MKRAVLYLRVSTLDQTTANQERELREIAVRHPGYVSVFQKDYKGSDPRKEPRCEWKKALDDGVKKKAQYR
jgi:DNA invertase Pin-like site-specific DNA recombinase